MYLPNNTNLAYDLSLFDTEEAEAKKAQRAAKPKIKALHKSAAKSGNIMRVIILAAAALFLALTFLLAKAQFSELSAAVNTEQAAFDEAKTENSRLHSALDSLVTLDKVEEYATTKLGMQKIQCSQIQHIAINIESTTQVADSSNGNVFVQMENMLNGIVEYLGF